MDSITVLMSTYNGEKYLRPQLDSLFSQKNVRVGLIVRDDGSSDSTLSILRHYQGKYPDKIVIISGENLGFINSFRFLLRYAADNNTGCNYFAFADQDDIWLPEKLEKAVSALSPLSQIPALYFSNLFYYKDGKNQGAVYDKQLTPTFKNCLARNRATGCTIVFNRNLLNLIANDRPEVCIPHDHWAYLCAVLCGQAIYDPEASILYRQHQSNQIGIRHNLMGVWKARLKRFRNPEFFRIREKTAKELLRLHSSDMLPEALRDVKKMAEYNLSFKNRIRMLFDSGYSLENIGNDLFFKLRILLGRL